MGLLSIFSGSKPDSELASEGATGDSVSRARTRARQRLLGAVVLVGIGIVGFPILFETQPRPIPVDVPIEIPARDGVEPLKLPSERRPSATPALQASAVARGKTETVITESAAEAGTPVAGADKVAPEVRVAEKPPQMAVPETEPAAEQAAAASAAAKAAARGDERASDKANAKPGDMGEDKAAAQAADAARARALLEGKPASKEASGTRYIVQIGAFADPALARATRLKVERLGLTTYTHVAKTANGDRTRVRVGPVTSREEAEKIAAKIKAAGLEAGILTL